MKYGLIAGGGRFPLLVLDAANRHGHSMTVVAIQEEASLEIERAAETCHWISLGELSKLIEILQSEGITQVVMAGRVQLTKIFSSIRPDCRLVKILASLASKNTDSLLGAVAETLASAGIELLDSTTFLKPSLASEGTLTKREPTKDEMENIIYGRRIAKSLSQFDVGQTVVICEQACVAVEAMEGTDAVIERAAKLSKQNNLTVVKVAKPDQNMRFDVPVIGTTTIKKMKFANATALAVEAGKTLLLDRSRLLESAEQADITIVGSN